MDPGSDSAYGRQKSRVLLAALLCARGAVHRELLRVALARPGAGACLRALQTTLYELRRALEPGGPRGVGELVVAEGETYRLALAERDQWDLARVEALARDAAEAADAGARLAPLIEAEQALAGPFLAEWPYADWARERREVVAELERSVVSTLAESLAEAGRPAEAAARLRRLAAAEPEREAWHRALMRVYALAGERALALRQYHACRAALRREMGVEPGPETHDLYLSLLRAGGP